MTPSQAANIKPEDLRNLPWDYAGMIICPGRYYYAMFSIPFKVMPGNKGKGGDVAGLIWRFSDKPDDWILTYRFRYYAGENNNAWDGADRKQWYAVRVECTEEEVGRKAEALVDGMGLIGLALCGGLPGAPEWVKIQGDYLKAGDVLHNNPPAWMHSRVATKDEKTGRVTKIETKLTDLPNQ